jgi:DNA-binding helix-hairpin-helix protein with protein kinase domain
MTQYSLLRTRTRVQLGQKMGEGGEGAIYAVPNCAGLVAKVYSTPPDARKSEKLLAMPGLVTDALRKTTAWPLDLLVDGQDAVRGFVMPEVAARKDIHELYGPKSRARTFPEADFPFLVHVCGNIARAFAVIHGHGHVIGDINQGSVLVGQDGTVAIIDCDSFQVKSGREVFTCDVGAPLFTAPEIQGRPLRGYRRTPNHDHFGLAVMLFHLLCLGRHPFAGRYAGSGDMPIEKAIAEYRFAYGRDRKYHRMERPPGTLPLEALGGAVGGLFEWAFASAGATSGRPDDKAWVAALDELKSKLRACSTAKWHHYSNELTACPWCVVESQTGVRLFGQRVVSTSFAGVVDVATLWKAIAAVPHPGPNPPLPSERPWIPPPGTKVPGQEVRKFLQAVGFFFFAGGIACFKEGGIQLGMLGLILCGIGLVLWFGDSVETRNTAQREVAAAKAEYDAFSERWSRDTSVAAFADKFRALEAVRAELSDLPNERQHGLAKLAAEREARQRTRYLDGCEIARATIYNIGASRTAMLASYGIETAADVDESAILKIPGFGPTYTAALVAWRKECEREFRVDPNEPINPLDVAALDNQLEARRQRLISALRQGPVELQIIRQEIDRARQCLMPLLDKSWSAFKLAEARLQAI